MKKIKIRRQSSSSKKVGSAIAFLTEIYFCFSQYSMFKTMSMASAIIDTIMWTLINGIVGALVAWILEKAEAKDKENEVLSPLQTR